MFRHIAPFIFASAFFLAVLVFVVVILIKRKRNKAFMDELPRVLPAQVIQWKNKAGKDWLWYKSKEGWLTLQKKTVTSIDSQAITKVDFIFYMTVTNTAKEKLYEHLYPLLTKANKGRVIPSDPQEIFKGDEAHKQAKNMQGFFSPQLMLAPFVEIFGEKATPLDSQKREWILRAIFPFKADLSYLRSWIQTLVESERKKF